MDKLGISEGPAAAEEPAGLERTSLVRRILGTYGIIIVLVALCLMFGALSPVFFSSENVLNILRQVAVVGIVAVGMTFVILTGGIDLSVGSIIGIASVFTAKAMLAGMPVVWAVALTLVMCALFGLFNGLIVNELFIPPLVATLGTMTAVRGVAFIISGGLPVFGFSNSLSFLGQGYLWMIPFPVVVMALTFALGFVVLDATRFGRYVYGVGGNEEATRLSGIGVKAVKALVYTISGFLSGLAGVVLLSRINSGQPKAGQGYEMDVITAVVIGGVSISGGEGNLLLVVAGVLIMGVLSNGMILLNIDEYVQWVVKGLVLLAAVGFDRVSQRRKLRA
jgi:ribose/xylose/arabinose/galactoside ABC-type transport system permease subunit